jgi:hypothetical protein
VKLALGESCTLNDPSDILENLKAHHWWLTTYRTTLVDREKITRKKMCGHQNLNFGGGTVPLLLQSDSHLVKFVEPT